ncbi:hypothetical protein DRP53_04915 [candidate division WOR-3 bacterium]|uniref:LytR/CpsA/Psr regulator C-terminal domain-containing protein n=1 Tax=candidate division WOR-3 bacterium TaxID=2052148 RepID=A0A660SI72_UNCW3|nr:MAG: hypothetical protein DRP53_04915 [candidate division WOR-3 bacterium]
MGRANFLFIILGGFILISGISLYYHFENRKIRDNVFENARLRVEVLNGCGVDNLAMLVSDELRRLGFDVVETGNATSYDFKETVIIDRTDPKLRNAHRLGGVIGCTRFGKDIDSSLYIDVTILLGKDYLKYFPSLKNRPRWMH